MHIDAIVSIRVEEIKFKVWYLTCWILHIVQFKNTNLRTIGTVFCDVTITDRLL